MSGSLAIPFKWNEGSRGRLVKDAELEFGLGQESLRPLAGESIQSESPG